MTYSKLAAKTVPHHNKFHSRKGRKITRLIVHHWGGTAGGDTRLMSRTAPASANYILYSDGTLVSQVSEEYRAWTSGSWDADASAITVEVQNIAAGGQWPVSDKSIAKLIELAADVGRRHKWGKVDRTSVRGHREFQATACPGPYLYSKLGYIAQQANAKLKGGASTAKPAAKAPAKPAPKKPATKGSSSIDKLARDVIAGKYGTGNTRKKKLGSQYNAVQKRVNEILAGKKASAPKKSSAPTSAQIDKLAREVIAGKHGNGAKRKRSLGANYAAVQRRVNQLLK